MPTILIATDFSEAAREAVKQGSALAKELGASIELVSVVPTQTPLFPDQPLNIEAVASLEERDEADARAALEKIGRGSPVPVRRTVLHGRPADAIAEHAEKRRARMIVVGSEGHSQVGSLLLGSTTDRLLRRSSVPVLVVRPKAKKGR